MASFKPIKMGETSKGDRLAIAEVPQKFMNIPDENGKINVVARTEGVTYTVYIETTNYSKGRDIKSWKYIVKEVSKEEAEKVFKRRNKKGN